MEKQRIKEKILRNLREKPIVIFGAGLMAHRFYERFKDKLDFAFCVTNNSKEWGRKRFCGELDVRGYVDQNLKDKYYIVLAIYFQFDEVAVQLECDDYVMFDDFVDYKVAESVIEGKKLVLMYGQCVLRDVYHLLERIPAYTDKYTSVFIQVRKDETIVECRRLYYGKEVCDVYVYARKLIHLSEPYNIQSGDLSPDCKMIGVSNLVFEGYWPQISKSLDYYDDWIFPVNTSFDNYFWHLMYSREDTNISKFVRRGKSPEEIYNIVSKKDFYSEKQVKRHLRICFKTIDMAENGLDITIGDFIKERYAKEFIYHDFVHLSIRTLWEYAKRLLDALDIQERNLDEIMENSEKYIHLSSEMPVYPSVASVLGLDWINSDTKYYVQTWAGVKFMTFKEYVIHYADYMRNMLKLKKEW